MKKNNSNDLTILWLDDERNPEAYLNKESKQNITFNNLYCPIKTSYVLSYGEFCRCLYKKDKK